MTSVPLLSVRGVNKSFGAIKALQDITVDLHPGELIGIVGDNGAGKSTLIKIISGVLKADSGEIQVKGKPVQIRSPQDAARLGIETVYQDLALAPNLNVVGNVFLGREPTISGFGRIFGIVDRQAMRLRVTEELKQLKVSIPNVVDVDVSQMSGGQRQAVAIVRTSVWASKLLLMDEPTAALGVKEAEAVLELIQEICERGIAVIMVSHILPHILDLANRIIVLRHGMKVAELSRDAVTHDRLIRLILGYEAGEINNSEVQNVN